MTNTIDYSTLKVKFLKAFVNLPERVREDVIVVVDDKPFSWNAAAIEIKNSTSTGRKILNVLRELGVL